MLFITVAASSDEDGQKQSSNPIASKRRRYVQKYREDWKICQVNLKIFCQLEITRCDKNATHNALQSQCNMDRF